MNDYTVQVYNVTADSVIANVLVPSTTSGQAAGDRQVHYVDIAPLSLTAGQTYLIAMNQSFDGYRFDSAITSDSRIGYISGVGVSGDLPASASGFNIERNNSYFGPNFKYISLSEDTSFNISQPLARATYQRNSNNVAQVTFTGNIGEGVDRIEGRATPRAGFKGTPLDWIELPDIGSNKYSHTVALTGGWYDIDVRTLSNGIPVSTSRVERVGVGEVFIMCGQSNSANHGKPAQSPPDDCVNVLNLNNGRWSLATDPQPGASGAGGSPWPDFGTFLARRTGTPVAVISVGQGATTVAQWLPNGALYQRILHAHNALKPTGGFRAILWHQGESDSLAATDAATYASRLTTIIDQSRADTGFMVPWGVALASYHPSASATNKAVIIDGQKLVISNRVAVFQGAETDSFHTNNWLHDSVHFNDLGLRDHGRQWMEVVWDSLSSATDDADGDGTSNLREYKLSTEPTAVSE